MPKKIDKEKTPEKKNPTPKQVAPPDPPPVDTAALAAQIEQIDAAEKARQRQETVNTLAEVQRKSGLKFQSKRQEATQDFLSAIGDTLSGLFGGKEEDAAVAAPPPAPPPPEGDGSR